MLISAVFFEGDNLILEKEITYSTDFGDVVVNLKEQMDKKGISINMMSRLSNVKYEIVKKYQAFLKAQRERK